MAVIASLATACGNAGRGTAKTDGALRDSVTLQIEKIGETDTGRACS